MKISKFKAARKFFGVKAMKYDLEKRFIEFMNFIDENPNYESAPTLNGHKLPSYVNDWLKGNLTSNELVDYLVYNAKTNPKNFKFLDKTEKELIIIASKMFLPKNNASVTVPNKETVRIIKKCKDKKDMYGNNINTVYIASNNSPQTFDLLEKTFPDQLGQELFDDDKKFISGKMGITKPNPQFFDTIISKTKLNPRDCILIDDQESNLKGARSAGWQTIKYKNAGQLAKDLKKRKLI